MSTLSHWVAAALAATMLTHTLPAAAQDQSPSQLDRWSQEAQASLSKGLVKHRPSGMPSEPEGVTDVVFTVGQDGRPARVSVLHSSGHKALDRRAVAAVRGIQTRSPAPSQLAGGQEAVARIVIASGDRKLDARGIDNLIARNTPRSGWGQLDRLADNGTRPLMLGIRR